MEEKNEFENNGSLLYTFCPCEAWNDKDDKRVLAYYGYTVQEERYFYLDNDFENSKAMKFENFSIVGFCDINLAKANKRMVNFKSDLEFLDKERNRLSRYEYPDTMGQ